MPSLQEKDYVRIHLIGLKCNITNDLIVRSTRFPPLDTEYRYRNAIACNLHTSHGELGIAYALYSIILAER